MFSYQQFFRNENSQLKEHHKGILNNLIKNMMKFQKKNANKNL